MSVTPNFDKVSFPGGYKSMDMIVAVKLAAMMYVMKNFRGNRTGILASQN